MGLVNLATLVFGLVVTVGWIVTWAQDLGLGAGIVLGLLCFSWVNLGSALGIRWARHQMAQKLGRSL
jgi:hypothetical protein